MRPLKQGERVRFTAYGDLSTHEAEGVVEGEAKTWIEANKNQPEIDPSEYEGLEEGEAYIVKRKDAYGNIQRHLVFIGDMIEVLGKEE